MRISKDSYQRIVDNLYDGLYLVDLHRIIRYWNKGAERISGFSAAEAIGKSCADNILTHIDGEGNLLCRSLCPLAETMRDGEAREAEVYLHHKNGHRLPVSVRISTLRDVHGNVIGGVELFTDISGFKSHELKVKELEDLAFFDRLTRLTNRTRIENELQIRFEEQKRFGVPFGILFVDIDHFKIVNDAYGHEAGDRVLRVVADTLSKNARPFDVFGRWGGEEFIGIIRNIDREDLAHLGDRLRLLVANSYIPMDEERLSVTISIGATLTRPDDTIDSILKRADSLLYESKREGRNRLTLG